LIALLIKKPTWARPVWFILVVLGGLAAYFAGYKPF
jgi:hypothetical protein